MRDWLVARRSYLVARLVAADLVGTVLDSALFKGQRERALYNWADMRVFVENSCFWDGIGRINLLSLKDLKKFSVFGFLSAAISAFDWKTSLNRYRESICENHDCNGVRDQWADSDLDGSGCVDEWMSEWEDDGGRTRDGVNKKEGRIGGSTSNCEILGENIADYLLKYGIFAYRILWATARVFNFKFLVLSWLFT
jgi:hypothetical protein